MQKISTTVQVVAAALIDGDGRVLLQKRRADRMHGGLWEFPGGKLESGETPEFGLIREIFEELGIRLAAESLHWLASASESDDKPNPIVISLYTCRIWPGEPLCLDAQALGWFTPAELAGLVEPPAKVPPLDIPLAQALLQAI